MMIDKSKMKFGRLTPISPVRGHGKLRWLCKCDCGNTKIVFSSDLGVNSNSCGCLRKEITKARRTTHGLSNTRTYTIWWDMKLRCYYPSSRHYYRYGMRGIKVCKRWMDGFQNFLDDMGECPSSKHSLDRINNEGNYTPENCRWATSQQQAQNTRTNHMISWQGQTKCIAQWERDLGFPSHCLQQRISKRKWSIEKAFTTPIKTPCQKKLKS
jgi:hypothetical protein